MVLKTLFPHLAAFRFCGMGVDGNQITFTLRPKGACSRCPACNSRSRSMHSHYTRTLMDLSVCGIQLCLILYVRRFRCRRTKCARAIFCERLPTLAPAYARSTVYQQQSLEAIGLALGGNPGALLAAALSIPASSSTVLRRIHAVEEPAVGKVRVLGVDDWALRKGTRYGTVLCDLEQQRAIDLLPDRSAESLATWLAGHPEIEIISRDRGGIYAQGAATGAPKAQQVADRFHLLQNLTDVLRRILDRHHADLKAASQEEPAAQPEVIVDTESETPPQREAPPSIATPSQQRRQALFEEIKRRIDAGQSIRAISRELNIHRATVRRNVGASAAPPISKRNYAISSSLVAGYSDMIDALIDKGERCMSAIFKQLKGAGYKGSVRPLYTYVRKRHPEIPTHKRQSSQPSSTTARHTPLSPRAATWLLLKDAAALSERELRLRERLISQNAVIATASSTAQTFSEMVRKRQPEKLDTWLNDAAASDVEELCNFAKGLERDYAAVRAGLTLQWSNGPVEGHVNRLKLIKRTMYGRAGMDLLKKRYLNAR